MVEKCSSHLPSEKLEASEALVCLQGHAEEVGDLWIAVGARRWGMLDDADDDVPEAVEPILPEPKGDALFWCRARW